MKVLIVSPKSRTLLNFRGDLIEDITKSGHMVTSIGPETGYEIPLKARGSRFIHLPMKKESLSISENLGYMRALRRIFRSEAPDLVFSYTIKPVIYASLAAKKEDVPHRYAMITGLGRIHSGNSLKQRILRLVTGILYRRAFAACDRVFFQNTSDLETFVQNGFLRRDQAVHVNGSGVNMERFTPSPLPRTLSFLMIARLIREKGVLEYLEAARIVHLRYPDVPFRLLGAFDHSIGGLPEAELRPLFAQSGVEYLAETEDVRPHLAACSVYVLPTYYREGLPRTLLEAMASGRPLITTDWPGCRDTVAQGENGFLVPPRDAQALADRMVWMIEHPKDLPRMAGRSLILCKAKFEVHKVNRKMMRVMDL